MIADFKDSVLSSSGGDFLAALSAVGLNDGYERWNGELTNIGFVCNYNEKSVMQRKSLSYYYHGHLEVHGDHAYDLFAVSAVLTPHALVMIYRSSYLESVYLEMGGIATPEIYDNGLKAVRAFLAKHERFIGGYGKKITVNSDGYFEILLYDKKGAMDSVRCALGCFEKLAVLLDMELGREYPFESISGYEKNNRNVLNAVLDSFTKSPSVDCPNRIVPIHVASDMWSLRKLAIASSYGTTKDEAVSNFTNLAEKRLEHDAACGLDVADTRRQYAILLEELVGMKADEYENYKLCLFDL